MENNIQFLIRRSRECGIYGEQNGKGIEQDISILKKAITELGHEANSFSPSYEQSQPADVNIFIESLNLDQVKTANHNWFIPNPEWYIQDLSLLDNIDLILCRTKEVERIFKNLGKKTYFLGFTSEDCHLDIEKNYFSLLHIAGSSKAKGTKTILDIWKQDLPLLTVIRHFKDPTPRLKNLRLIPIRILQEDLRIIQNKNGIHLCPSEVEGFGHCIFEAFSTGAVVVTTDAPPMNEFIKDKRCLVPFTNSAPSYLGVSYFVDPIALDAKIRSLLSLPPSKLQKIGEANRAYYLEQKQKFQERLTHLLNHAL